MKPLCVLIVSDSTGETGEIAARAWISQFAELEPTFVRKPNVISPGMVDEVFRDCPKCDLLINSVVMPVVTEYLNQACQTRNIPVINLFDGPLETIERVTGLSPRRLPGLTRRLNTDYFDKIESIEFAVKYDDGKDKRGLLKADIVLVGISRTSKTPLSLFLANKGYNVANLPLVPEVDLPEELFRVDPRRIIGLIISPEKLNTIRVERLKSLGIATASPYADNDRIREELEYATGVFDDLGCRVIDVSESTIEKTAAKILSHLTSLLGPELRRHEKA